MGFSLKRDYALDILHLKPVGCRLISRSKLLDNRTLRESHIILVSRKNLSRVLFGGLLNHSEERAFLLYAINDKLTTENLMTAMLRVDLCETEYLRVCQWSAILLFDIVQIFHLFWREGETFFLVKLLKVVNELDRFWSVFNCEDGLVQTLIHTLQHRVVVGILRTYREVLLYTRNAVKSHVLGYLNSIRTPWCYHLTAWANKVSSESLGVHELGIAKEPTKFVDFVLTRFVVNLSRNYILLRSLKEQNHKIMFYR